METRSRKIRFDISFATLLKIAVFCIGLVVLHELGPVLMVVLLAALMATALEPILQFFERFVPRWVSILGVVLLTGVLIGSLFALVLPPLVEQTNRVLQSWPHFKDTMLTHLPARGPLKHLADLAMSEPMRDVESWIPKIMIVGQSTITALTSVVLIFVLMVYFLIEGSRVVAWITAFFTEATRDKLLLTGREITPLISAYVVGQFITSLCCAIFVYTLLKSLGVPAAVMLGVVAGIFDILPIIGFFLSIVPSLVFSLTVSPDTALLVVFAYGCYHLFEAYILVPRIYGNRLRLSGLAVLLGLLVAAEVAGVPGALVVLPLLSSYPIIERIWLTPYIGQRAVAKHEKIEEPRKSRRLLTKKT